MSAAVVLGSLFALARVARFARALVNGAAS